MSQDLRPENGGQITVAQAQFSHGQTLVTGEDRGNKKETKTSLKFEESKSYQKQRETDN